MLLIGVKNNPIIQYLFIYIYIYKYNHIHIYIYIYVHIRIYYIILKGFKHPFNGGAGFRHHPQNKGRQMSSATAPR